MLHIETVESGTFSLLKQLQNIPELTDFYLVGGTALSLKYGHRISIDLDLFGHQEFDKEKIVTALEKEFKDDFAYEGNPVNWAVFGYIRNIKVDIIKYKHPVIAPVETLDSIRMYSTEDIIAMKLNAILGRGKKKDLWDIYELLHHYSLQQMIELHSKKYPSQQLLISIPQALTYFEDAENSEEPVSLKGQTWDSVKEFIQQKVREYLS